jgi:hypothetical protein
MKIKTANVGGIDFSSSIIEIEVNTKPIEGYSNRLSGKWYKTHHNNEDIIWLDSSYQIYNKNFHNYVEELLGDNDFMITNHPQRKTLKEEYDYILNNLNDPYLKVRYENEPWTEEIEAFKDSLAAKLVNPAFFAARKTTTDLMNKWWQLILDYTIFDQSQISYLLHHNKDLKIKYIDWSQLYPYVRQIGHKKLV